MCAQVPEIDDEHALTRNLGLPIVVACCKVDVAPTLERNFHFHDDHFEFIQQHLRKLCIQCRTTQSFPLPLVCLPLLQMVRPWYTPPHVRNSIVM